jgi:hypothetical protein
MGKRLGTPRAVGSLFATGWKIGILGFDSRRGLGIFLFTTASRTALEPTQPPIQWVPGALTLGIKRPGLEADHSPPSSAEVKNAWSYTSTPPVRLHGGAQLKYRDNFTFTHYRTMQLNTSVLIVEPRFHHMNVNVDNHNQPLVQKVGADFKELFERRFQRPDQR